MRDRRASTMTGQAAPSVTIQEATPLATGQSVRFMDQQDGQQSESQQDHPEACTSCSPTKNQSFEDSDVETVRQVSPTNIPQKESPANSASRKQLEARKSPQTSTKPPPVIVHAPPARQLSRLPQQLYIKTTPAIPMNANIQHILSNVARTEGPFDAPANAVKPALIALHDNAW